jgi:hypothetical protein
MSLRLYALAGSIAALLAAAVWLMLPGRNVHGNPWLEEPIASCSLPSGVLARFYEGNGGATTDYWYTITVRGGGFKSERQIFFAYGLPKIESLECASGEVRLIGESEHYRLPERAFEALRGEPMSFWRGRRVYRPEQPLAAYARHLALVPLALAAGLVIPLRREYRRAIARNARKP